MILRRAIRDTVQGHLVGIMLLALGGILSIAFLYFQKGQSVAYEEIPYVQGGLVGAVGALALYFLWNLICAPYRVERDRRIQAETKSDALERPYPNTELKTVIANFADLDKRFDSDWCCKTLSDWAGTGVISVWARAHDLGLWGYPTESTAKERHDILRNILIDHHSPEVMKSIPLQELPPEFWKNHYLSAHTGSNERVGVLSGNMNGIAINMHVGLGSARFDVMLNSSQLDRAIKLLKQ